MPRNALQTVPEMRPTPRNALLGAIADALQAGKGFANKAQIPAGVPLLGGQGLGDVLLGQAPQELSEWSYGNAPMRINPNAGRTASYVPEMKPGRKQGFADMLGLATTNPGRNALMMGLGAMDNGAMNRAATVWHGSPHKFDKFDSSKIGTGEGAQAYGHGLYLAESDTVARHYKNAGADPSAFVPVRSIRDPAQMAATVLDRAGGDMRHAIAVLSQNAQSGDMTAGAALQMLKQRAALPESKYAGHMYKVDLPDEKIARMLDWDAPLSRQAPEVKKALRKQGISGKEWQYQVWGDGPAGSLNDRYIEESALAARKHMLELRAQGYTTRTYQQPQRIADQRDGAEFMRGLARDPAVAAQKLQDMGIPGIRYLDGGSRTAGQGTRNYVVFPGEENALTILERNGQRLR